MSVEQFDLEGLPKPFVRALEVMVEMAHRLAGHPKQSAKKPIPDFPRWEGRVIGNLSRKELYDEV